MSLFAPCVLLLSSSFPTPPQAPKPQLHQLNVFTSSTQDAVTVAASQAGTDAFAVAAWQSRKQEHGTDGVRARLLGAHGQPLGGEIAINESSGMLKGKPAVALDAAAGTGTELDADGYPGDGVAWFSWLSVGPDGSAVFARTFRVDRSTGAEASLAPLGPEVRISLASCSAAGEPTMTRLEDGRALCTWTSETNALGGRALHGRIIDRAGEVTGEIFRIDDGSSFGVRTASVAAKTNGAIAAFIQLSEGGVPSGIQLSRITLHGGNGVSVDGLGSLAMTGIEPAIAVGPEGATILGWLDAPEGTADYVPYMGQLAFASAQETSEETDQPRGPRVSLQSPMRLSAPAGPGYTSGLDLCAVEDGWAAAWCWREDRAAPRLDGALIAPDLSEVSLRPIGPGDMDAADCSDALVELAPGVLLLSASGDAMAGHAAAKASRDTSGAYSVLWGPAVSEASRKRLALSGAKPEGVTLEGDAKEAPDAGDPVAPTPHDPPIFTPGFAQRRNAGGATSPFLRSASDLDFQAFDFTLITPPDPELAVGPDHFVACVNAGLKVFDRQGTELFFSNISSRTTGIFAPTGFDGRVFDPEVLWDIHSGRYLIAAAERDDDDSYILFGISAGPDPVGPWFTYQFDLTPLIESGIDSVNVSADDNTIYLSGDDVQGGFRFVIVAIEKASILGGGVPTQRTTVIPNRRSFGTPFRYDPGSDEAYFVRAFSSTTPSTEIRIHAIEDPLTSPNELFVSVPVPPYSRPTSAPQGASSERVNTFDTRFWSSLIRDGSLWATHHHGNPVTQRWYEFDLKGWPSSGQDPELVQWGDVDGGPSGSTFFGSIGVDSEGNMSITCAQSSPTDLIAMMQTGRAAGDPPGTLRPLELVARSQAPSPFRRWGDYSGTQPDPGTPGRFFGHHQVNLTRWTTRISSYDICSSGTEAFCPALPNSSGSPATLTTTGSLHISDNTFGLQASPVPPNAFGVFFYGDARIQAPAGDGLLCVLGNTARLPIVQADSQGIASTTVDFNAVNRPILAGSTWSFQFFYRDLVPAGLGFNFSTAVEVQFCD